MNRSIAFSAVALLMLAGCGQGGSGSSSSGAISGRGAGGFSAPRALEAAAPASADVQTTGSRIEQQTNAPKLAYSHSMSLEMAAANIEPRYDRARTSCLNDATMGCVLVHASIERGDPQSGTSPSATMTVRLPHDKIAAFEQQLLSPLPGEAKGQPILRQSTTDAEDLTYAIADGERRLQQAEDYRDRLTELAKSSQAKVQDLIQIEEKLSEVQSQIEQLTADQRQLNQRVDTEVLSIELDAVASIAQVQSPLAEAWRNAGRVLGESAANAFTFTVSALPWLPLIALLVWIALRLWRIVRGHRRHRPSGPAPTSNGTH